MEGLVLSQISNNLEKSTNDLSYERNWERSFLRKLYKNQNFEGLYKSYVLRLQRSYLSIFLVLHTSIALIHTILLLAFNTGESSGNVDIFVYLLGIFIVWILLFFAFREEFIKKRPWIPFVISSFTVFTLVLVDSVEPLHHSANISHPLRPTYSAHVILVLYIFLPLADNAQTLVLGIATTICYLIIFSMVTYRSGIPGKENLRLKNIIMETLFLFSMNFFGIYYRLINEIVIRKTFFDRRDYVEQSLLLKYAQVDERKLLLKILPSHTATALEKDISEMIKRIKSEQRRNVSFSANVEARLSRHVKNWGGQAIKKTYVETHSNTSILYADIVNYTMMTSSLEVKPLVETLNELFVKFDQASEENNVLRIKFLGDCYCCVSGVPQETPNHAKNCVELGLRMIKIIKQVREKHGLDIDMRIGVHSGSIIAGVIGALKWQYDIWSKDVAIANKLESTGVPGMIHVTEQTFNMLQGNYSWSEGTEKGKKDALLIENGIKTYLIKPYDEVYDPIEGTSLGPINRVTSSSYNARTSEGPSASPNFMKTSIELTNKMLKQVHDEMKKEIELMPIGKFHFNKIFSGKNSRRITEIEKDESHLKRLSTLFLYFKDRKFEFSFINEADLMFKYSLALAFVTFLFVAALQGTAYPLTTFGWYNLGFCGLVMFVLMSLAWYRKLWLMLTPVEIDDNANDDGPSRNPWKYLYYISYQISNGAFLRTTVYLAIICLLLSVSITHVRDGIDPLQYNAWVLTKCIICVICVNFLILRIHFLVKFLVGLIICGLYTIFILKDDLNIFKNSYTINPVLEPDIAHLMSVWITFVTFHLVDRQTEYISRIDYNWKEQLLRGKEEAEITKETNNILMCNILPSHVAEIFINQKLKDVLYYEKYEDQVAVMFATVTDFNINMEALNILNQIICNFDEKVLTHRRQLKIEKIKVAGWTYMAACGLDPGGRGDSSTSIKAFPEMSIRSSTGRREQGFRAAPSNPSASNKNSRASSSVYVLTEFALQLMSALNDFNEENFDSTFKLRVGISHGVVMAGVIGSSKPLYDIWGDAVNMASRMESTGEAGRIQVTKSSAAVLQSLGIECTYAGFKFIKGAGQMETFFVPFDKNYSVLPLITSTAL